MRRQKKVGKKIDGKVMLLSGMDDGLVRKNVARIETNSIFSKQYNS